MSSKYSAGYILYILNRCLEAMYCLLVTVISQAMFRFQCCITGSTYGKNSEICGKVILRCAWSSVHIGDNVKLISSSWRCNSGALNHPVKLRTFMRQASIVIGNDCGINGTSITCRSTSVRIGDGTMIAPNVTILDSDFHIPWPPEQRNHYPGNAYDAAVDIGKRVWIGAGSIILKGVTIGDNTIIGAGSVVTQDIPANTCAAGNPARVVKHYR